MFTRLREECVPMIVLKIYLHLKPLFLEDPQLVSTSVLGNIYNIFGFDPLFNLHLGSAKLLKNVNSSFLVQKKR